MLGNGKYGEGHIRANVGKGLGDYWRDSPPPFDLWAWTMLRCGSTITVPCADNGHYVKLCANTMMCNMLLLLD